MLKIYGFSQCFIFIFFITGFDGALIQFYKNKNYSGLLFQSTSTNRCNNVLGGQQFIGSIKTDTCLIVYRDSNCKSEWSWRKNPNDGMIWPSYIGSYHICNEFEGGSNLNIDITTHSQNPLEETTVLKSYKNMCSCKNIPTYIQDLEKWSINNHANDLQAFYESDCSETKYEGERVRAGFSQMSRNIHALSKTDSITNIKYKIQSIAPIPNSSYKCGIMDMELMEMPSKIEPENSELLESRPIKKRSRPRIQFFQNTSFAEYLFDRHPTTQCTNLPKPTDTDFVTNEILSIKTNTCVMLHSNKNCGGRSIKVKTGEHPNLKTEWESTVTGSQTLVWLYKMNPNWKWDTKSFKNCDEPNSRLNVDITEYQDENQGSTPNTLKQFRDVCTCQNIPKFIRTKETWSINNFGNSLVAYFEHDCMSEATKSLLIPAGHSSFTIGFGSFKQVDNITGEHIKIQSFGPDPNSAYFRNSCVKMFSEIIKFEIEEPTKSNHEEQNVNMTASKTRFYNNGPSQIRQSYTASKSIRQVVQVDKGKSFSKMNSVHVDKSVDIETRKHKGSSESNSTGTNMEFNRGISNSESRNEGYESRQSISVSTHESVNGQHTTNLGGSVTIGGEVEGGGSFLGIGAKIKKSASATVSAGYSYSSQNVQGSNTGSENVQSNSGSRTAGQENSYGLSEAKNVGFDKSSNFFQEDGLRQGLRKAYDKSGTQSGSNSKSNMTEDETTFSVTQDISVPPCTETVVHASVKVVTNKRVDFKAMAKITGMLGDREMTAGEVYEFMDRELKYIRDLDEHTVLVYSTGVFTAKYGVSSIIMSEGSVIQDCQAQLIGCPVCQTCLEANEQSTETYVTDVENFNVQES